MTYDTFILLSNFRRICKREYQRQPNWVLACELFSVGSTSAMKLCSEAGIDPDAKTVNRPPKAKQ